MDAAGLVGCSPALKWIVRKPVFVTWDDKDEGHSSLGLLSPLNGTTRMSINIGWRAETSHVLVVLHLPISIRTARKPRDMFLVVPIDSISTRDLDPTFAPVSSDSLEPELQSQLGHAGFAGSALFHITFKLSKSSHVVMPRARREKPVRGTPRKLMSMLKALSEARSFDAYFRFDSYAQLDLQKIFARLSTFSAPCLDLGSMYHGRGGAVDTWLDQGLDSDVDKDGGGDAPIIFDKDGTIHKLAVEPHALSPPPPPYPSHDDPRVLVSCSDVADSPPLQLGDTTVIPDTPPRETEYWTRLRELLDHRSPSFHAPTPPFSRKRSANTRGSPSADNALSSYPLPSSHSEKRRRPQPLPQFGSCLPLASDPTAQVRMIGELHGQAIPSYCESIAGDESASCSDLTDPTAEVVQWLYNAWTVCPRAHYDLRAELLLFGSATDKAAIREARAECSMRLAFTVARSSTRSACTGTGAADHTAPPFHPEEEVRGVVKWINEAKADADLYLVSSLITLAERAESLAGAESSTRAECETRFLISKAQCVAAACRLAPCATMYE